MHRWTNGHLWSRCEDTCRLLVVKVVLMCATLATTIRTGAVEPVSSEFLSHAGDYTFMWWPYGWRGSTPQGRRAFCVQTNQYGFAFDPELASFTHLGLIDSRLPEARAVAETNEVIFGLPKVELAGAIELDGRTFRVVPVVSRPDDVHIVEHGRFLQRIELHNCHFEDAAGNPYEAIPGRPFTEPDSYYEIVCWPDRLAILLHVAYETVPPETTVSIGLNFKEDGYHVEEVGKDARYVSRASDSSSGLVILRTQGLHWLPGGGERPPHVSLRSDKDWWESGKQRAFALVIFPFRQDDGVSLHERIDYELHPREPVTLHATGITPYKHPLEVAYDHQRGWYRVRLGRHDWDGWTVSKDRERIERVALHFESQDATPRTARIIFAKDEKFHGFVGLSPMIRDGSGVPVGLPVQISKNWHGDPWFHGATMARLPPDSTTDAEFTIAYAHWGGVPAVSHAQLCLVGWGANQLWHEVAIGSFGESICYDPDVCLRRSMIDDMRPLLVRSWSNKLSRYQHWGWTNNVGGGDFLVYFDEHGHKRYLSRVRSSYRRYAPNLSEVTYAGRTEDGRVEARITVAHARSDDFVRGLYRVRYDVRQVMPFQRLAFFQLGADRYNDHQFHKLARGNARGLIEEWEPKTGEPGYNRKGILCEGRMPWFSLHEAIGKSARANRGMIIRGWRARLGGRDVPMAHAAEYRTQDGPPSVLVELSPPPGIEQLEPGDFVEAEIEMIVIPADAEDYYGPNEDLRQALEADGNTWRMVFREAAGNDLAVTATTGTVERIFPPEIRCDDRGDAVFSLEGGLGYVPITISGVRDYRRCVLERRTDEGWQAVDQSVHGNDFWQADYSPTTRSWDLTFNVSRDGPRLRESFRLR